MGFVEGIKIWVDGVGDVWQYRDVLRMWAIRVLDRNFAARRKA